MYLSTTERLKLFVLDYRSHRQRRRHLMKLQDTAFDLILPLRGPLQRVYRNRNYEVELDGFYYGDPYATSVRCLLSVTVIQTSGGISWNETDEYDLYIPFGFSRARVAFAPILFDSDNKPVAPSGITSLLPLRRRFVEMLGLHYGRFANGTELTMLIGYLNSLDRSKEIDPNDYRS